MKIIHNIAAIWQIIVYFFISYFFTWQLSLLIFLAIFFNNFEKKTHVQRISKKYPRR